jgi:hypothetical protein
VLTANVCQTEARTSTNDYFPSQLTPRENPFYLDLPPSAGCTGTTYNASTATSAMSHPPSSRSRSTLNEPTTSGRSKSNSATLHQIQNGSNPFTRLGRSYRRSERPAAGADDRKGIVSHCAVGHISSGTGNCCEFILHLPVGGKVKGTF